MHSFQSLLKRFTRDGFFFNQTLKNTGPKTPEGRARCAQAKTIHGNDTRADRAEHSKKMAEIRDLEALGFKNGIFTGSRFAGRKPKPRG